MTDIRQVISNDLCVSCGICALNGNAEMTMKKGINVPNFKHKLEQEKLEYLYNVCPGKGYPIVDLGKKLFNDDSTTYDYRLGHYKSFGAATTCDETLLKESTSGGMMPMLANYLLEQGKVDGVLTVKFEYTDDGPIPKPFIALTKEDLTLSQGSKYRPIPLFQEIDTLLEFPGKLAVIGTPCQIAGIRLLQDKMEVLRKKIIYTIANFCGGYRDYRETERIFDIHDVEKEKVEKFSYRGNGQPGTMSIHQTDKPVIQLNYPDYARLTGFMKFSRCKLCVDATGELADISFGDAWLPEYLNSGKKWSFFITRSKQMSTLMEEIKASGGAEFDDITLDNLLKSQGGNLMTKKERQASRFRLYRILRKKLPVFDGGYDKSVTNLGLEIKVFLSHNFMYILEKLGIYLIFAKIFKRVKK